MRSGIQSLVEEEVRKERSERSEVKWNLFRRTNSLLRSPAPSLPMSSQKQNMKSNQEIDSSIVDLERSKTDENHDRRKSRAASMAVLFISTAMSPLKLIPAAHKTTRKYHTAKDRLNAIFDSSPIRAFMTVLTLYSLYSTNIRELALRKTYDSVFVFFSSVVFFLFLVEVIVKCFCQKGYLRLPTRKKLDASQYTFCNEQSLLRKVKSVIIAINIGSFYFYLDLISTLSMIFEVSNTEHSINFRINVFVT